MRIRMLIVTLMAGLLSSGPLFAQEKSDAQWKKELRERVMKRVQERLERENKRILEEVARILDEELGPESEGDEGAGEEEKSGAAPPREDGDRLKKAMKKFLDESLGEGGSGPAAKNAADDPEARAFLGVATTPVTAPMRKLLNLEEGQGVVVQEVVKDAPAARAGLESGDIILRIDGQQIGSPQELMMIIQSSRPGDKATLSVLRKKETREVEVTYARRPDEPGMAGGGGEEESLEGPEEEPAAAPPAAKSKGESGKTPKFEPPPPPAQKGGRDAAGATPRPDAQVPRKSAGRRGRRERDGGGEVQDERPSGPH
ncbi:MAG: PDZ domain-containing protein [Planctomycetes bacterium]|nr:PDZ domain-containing protein [Planctomycetota bacterium]